MLLSDPVLENPVNLEAAKLLAKDESLYRKVVQKLFQSAPPGKNYLPGFPWQLAPIHELFKANK